VPTETVTEVRSSTEEGDVTAGLISTLRGHGYWYNCCVVSIS